jgi:hypothetical protein
MACFTAASALLIIAIFLFTRGLCKRRRKAVFFISGLLFSISGNQLNFFFFFKNFFESTGLLTMVGVTLYVSITTEESVKTDQDHSVMECFYGYSFHCAIFSFVLQELTGVLTVYWFIYRFRALVRKQEKLRERTRQLMGNCLSMTTALPLNLASMNNHTKSTTTNQNHIRSNDLSNPLIYKQQQQRRRIPFDKSLSPPLLPRNEKIFYPVFPPTQSPTLGYEDYCRVLIRAEDMDLLTEMVKSKSQAQLLANSRPTTPAPKISSNSNISRRNTRKGVKRTTSV